jgi:hypothetical protein
MSTFVKSFTILLTLILLFFLVVLSDQEVIAQGTLKLDVDTKEEVVNKVADFMRDYYVFPGIGEKMGAYIKTKHSSGDYNSYKDVKKFCKRLTADLREICHDKHIFVFYSPGEAREVAARNNLLPAEKIEKMNKMYFEMDRRANFGFSKIEILDGNIGYLDLNYFSGADYACETAVGAMRFLSCSDAIIIDLRSNGGGGGGGVGSVLATYFFDGEKVRLSGAYFRSTDTIKQSWTLPYVPGKRMPDVDLYILTSSRTFSAAEDFCYSLKHLKRAAIVGETTKGGAHPVDVMIVKGSILTQISIGNSVNPITNSNWEGVGVKPDVEVSAEKALETAHLLALKNLLEKATDDALKQKLRSLIKRME